MIRPIRPRDARARRTRASRPGLTSLELLIAITITAITSLAVGAVTTSIARGMTSMNDTRSALQRSLIAHSRIQSQFIPAFCVLLHDAGQGFAVWQHDQRTNGRVNLSELTVFWFDPEGDGDITIEWVTFPEDWTEDQLGVADIELTGVDDYFQSMTTQRDLGYTSSTVVADGIAQLSVGGAGPSLAESNRVRVHLAVGIGDDDSEELLMVFGLVNHRTPD
jgi:hypothetical protein